MINFTKIIVEGFCSISNLELQLNDKGITIIKAPNGYGKTTIFSAICWVLYGKTLKGVSYVNTWDKYRPKKYSGTKVELYFTIDNKTHKIIRCQSYKGEVCGAKGNDRLIYFIDTEQVNEKSKINLQNLITKNLGMSYNLFINSVMFGQGMKRLIQESGSDKKNLFEEIFQLGYLTKAKKIAQDKFYNVDSEYNKLSSELDKLKSIYKSKRDSYILIKQKELNYTESIKSEIDTLNDKINLATKRLKEISPNKIDLNKNKLNKSINNLEVEIKKFRGKLDNAKKVSGISVNELIDKVIKLLKTRKYDESLSLLLNIKESFISIDKYTELIMSNTRELNKLRQEFSAIENKLSLVEHIKDSIRTYNDNILRIKNKKPEFSDIKSKYKSDLSLYRSDIKKLKLKLSKVSDSRNIYKWAYTDPFGNNGIKAFLFESSLSYLNEVLSTYSEILGFSIRFVVDLNSTKKDFITLITLDGQDVLYDELSGGQKQLVNLSMAFAMNEVMNESKGVNISFLDEVFESLSSDNIELVVNLIKKVYRDRTLFLITHHESLPISNAKVLKVNRVKGISHYEY